MLVNRDSFMRLLFFLVMFTETSVARDNELDDAARQRELGAEQQRASGGERGSHTGERTRTADRTATRTTRSSDDAYSLFLEGPPRTRPVRRAAIRPTFLPAGESRATVVA